MQVSSVIKRTDMLKIKNDIVNTMSYMNPAFSAAVKEYDSLSMRKPVLIIF